MSLKNRHWCGVATGALLLFLLSSHAASAQTPSPWTGVIRDDAEPAAGAFAGYSVVRQRGMSADGRFLVFDSDRTLVAGDTNGALDVFVRDRQTGALTRASVATNGTQGNSHSTWPAISANGRHVVFQSGASNFDPTDTNSVTDLYVRDLDTGVTSLVTVGPSGQRLTCNCEPRPVARLSGDGRFVVFSADFGIAAGALLWMRDRDTDQNGVFDEPGSVSTTGIDVSAIEGDLIARIDSVALSTDARYVAFAAGAYDENGTPLGNRVYLHYRTLGTSTRVDRPLPSSGDVIAFSLAPDFSDNGQLAYTSTAPNLVPGDADEFADLFVYDFATATNTRLQLTHVGTAFVYADGTAISADGRFVSFMGYEIDGGGTERWNVYAIDRQFSASFDISVRLDGSRDDNATGSSMSADGSAIAFNGGPDILQESIAVGGVFVATAVSMTSTVTQVSMNGGSVPVEIVVPADTLWTALLIEGTRENYGEVATYSGVGPGTVVIDISNSPSGEPTTYQVWLGSEAVVVQQLELPTVDWLDPYSGPTTGGTPFQITGSGFQDGATVTFDDVPATDVVVEEGGTVLHGVTPPHVAAFVTVTVTNPNGGTSPEPAWFAYQEETPPNQPPTANAGGPYTGVRNAAIAFTGAASSDPEGQSLTYLWNFGDGAAATGPAPTHAYATTGTFTVTLAVNDGMADSAPATATVTIANQTPVASAGGPYTGFRNSPVAFDGVASSDPDGDSLTYTWNFGDGGSGTGASPTHAYATLGTFTVTLTVNDGTADSAPITTTATIANRAPTANAGGPYSGVRNTAISFAGAASSDPDRDALTYSWNFGDGATGTGAGPAHAYATAGTFMVTLVVNDGMANSTPTTAIVSVVNQAPTAHPGGPYTGTRLADISFSGAASTDPEGDALTYAWNFGDGSTGSGVSPTHRYAALGTFTVTLIVNDGATSSVPVSTTVQIGNVGPAAALTSPASGTVFTVPSNIPVSAAASDPDGAVSLVEFYAGATKIGQATSAPYSMTWSGAAAGTYALTARVTDDSGAAGMSAPVSVTVNAPPSVVLTSPAANAQFAAPATITLSASASDSDGLVTQVEFFQGATSLGVDTTSPYTVVWSGVAPGSYVITAVGRDNLGAVVTTTGITVKVTASIAPAADAYVRSSTPNANLGTANALIVHWGNTSSNQRWAYVKFDLTSVPTISDAKLRVFGAISGTTSNVIQTAVYPVADTSWSETGITWNNKPSVGAGALSVVTVVTNSTTPRWYELDVTAYLQVEKAAGRNLVTLALKYIVQSTKDVELNSKEATSNRPALFVVP